MSSASLPVDLKVSTCYSIWLVSLVRLGQRLPSSTRHLRRLDDGVSDGGGVGGGFVEASLGHDGRWAIHK